MFEGVKLKRIRQSQKISQELLAEKINIHVNTIRRWEHDKQAPDAKKLELLARALDTTVAYLSGETDNPERQTVIDAADVNVKTPERDIVKIETQTRDRGELIFTLPNGSELRLPDTPENKVWFHDIVAELMTKNIATTAI